MIFRKTVQSAQHDPAVLKDTRPWPKAPPGVRVVFLHDEVTFEGTVEDIAHYVALLSDEGLL